MRNETEAASNTASALLEHAHIINHVFRVYKCTCANIKVGMEAKLRRENLDLNVQQKNEGLNFQSFFPDPVLLFRYPFTTTVSNQIIVL